MKIQVNRSLCAGLGICESMSPDFFEVGMDGQVVAHTGDVPVGSEVEVAEAAAACPNLALSTLA